MADARAQYVVKANARNKNGYSTTFEVVTSTDEAGQPSFGETREVGPGRTVMVLERQNPSEPLRPVLYSVSAGNPMVAAELQPRAGDTVRVTCTVADLPAQSGTVWMILDDGTAVEITRSVLSAVNSALADVIDRVPPAYAPPLPAEGGDVANTEPVDVEFTTNELPIPELDDLPSGAPLPSP